MTDTIRSQIRAFILENFLFGDTSQQVADDVSLIENDLVDSTGVLELVAFLEADYAIKVADADIVPANLDSVDAITAFVQRKRVQAAA